eukprot:GILK01004972.1.p1 GENE.GILK01004972.1~~GILK01004972.1.p1  ORF type:complete len:213 (-),score=38.11 GILK01004972.1:144-782(-)
MSTDAAAMGRWDHSGWEQLQKEEMAVKASRTTKTTTQQKNRVRGRGSLHYKDKYRNGAEQPEEKEEDVTGVASHSSPKRTPAKSDRALYTPPSRRPMDTASDKQVPGSPTIEQSPLETQTRIARAAFQFISKHSSSTEDGKVIVIVEVQTDQGVQRVPIREGADVAVLARKFCREHKMPRELAGALADLMRQAVTATQPEQAVSDTQNCSSA